MDRRTLAIGVILLAVGVVGLVASTSYLGAVSMERASEIADRYLRSLNNPDLAIGEIMEFEQNFYVVIYEKSTDIGAFEMLIDKSTGRIFPEYGPNMMWNTKYGHGGMMGAWGRPPTSQIPITQGEALEIAREFLDALYPGTVADDPHPFYGYYTLHVRKEGDIYGMLSVNGYDGTVWYHSWHGAYIRSLEMH
ncbi:hypothetical protein DRO42_01725 [Candidatus Bathyarchaeota archaeon]|nr:MAG: hypothetical protein DRO42_01725 [Candidatus Bathyarchaeota archaeon]